MCHTCEAVEDLCQQLPQLAFRSHLSSPKSVSFTHTLQISQLKARAVLHSQFYEYFSNPNYFMFAVQLFKEETVELVKVFLKGTQERVQ